MNEFLHMGGYGAYVWSAYALAAVVLGWNAIAACRTERTRLARLAERNAAEATR